ncbi:MAG: tetratricopeptide repeat protein [Candidatus Cloacimonetes bacterium]|nr:tetratricopeptide repeat protein [Candidatus Cloacimonadota bacterium]
MIKYIPDFIISNYKQNILNGIFKGFVLFLDIVGFSEITEQHAIQGQKGAAEISRLLKVTFGEPIRLLEAAGGFVTGFAGDAFIAVFPEITRPDMQKLAEDINEFCNSGKRESVLPARINAGYGDIEWQIILNDVQIEYYFCGQAIEQCCTLPEGDAYLNFTESFFSSESSQNPQSDCPHWEAYPQDEAFRSFLPKRYQKLTIENEIRDVSCVFISLSGIPQENIAGTIIIILQLAEKYEAFFNKLDFSDKGLLAVVIAGAPVQQVKVLQSMINFALEVCQVIPCMKIGLTRGKCFAGFSGSSSRFEYTILGFTPNLAARLMEFADRGEILVDRFTQELLAEKYEFLYQGKLNIKGFSATLPVYKFSREKNLAEFFKKTQFVGRSKELKMILEQYRMVKTGGKCFAFNIHGEAGIGKTRLLQKVRDLIASEEIFWCFLPCDNSSGKAYSPIIKMLHSLFQIYQSRDKEINIMRFRQLWQELTAGSSKMKRIEPLMAYLMGIEWENSLIQQLPASSLPSQLKSAIIDFFRFLAKSKILVINIDDAQWLDADALMVFQDLVKDTEKIFFLNTCRYLAEDVLVDLKLENCEKKDLILNRLPVSSTQELLRNVLLLEYIPKDTEQFIISKSQCNPLFVEQISWFLKEQELIDENGFITKDIEFVNTFSIAEVIGARIDSLSGELRKLVNYSSILGMEFNINILSRMMESEIMEELTQGEQKNVWEKAGDEAYVFSHVLLRDTAYNRMLDETRRELHQLAAASYEKVQQEENKTHFYELIGYHYEQAGKKIPAAQNFLEAGKIARSKFLLDKALQHYEKAFNIHQEQVPPDRFQIATDLHLLAVINCIKMNIDEGISQLQQALEGFLVVSGENSRETLDAVKDLGIAYRDKHDMVKAMEFARKERELLVKYHSADILRISDNYNRLGLLFYFNSEFDSAFSYFNKGLEILQNAGFTEKDYLFSYGHLAAIYHVRHDLPKALEYNLKVLEGNQKILPKDHYEIGRNHLNIGHIYSGMGRFEEALNSFDQAEKIQIKITGNDHPRLANIYSKIGNVYFDLHNYKLAYSYIQKALHIALKRLGEQHPDTAEYYSSLSYICLKTDKLDVAYDYAMKALEIREKTLGENNPYTGMSWRILGKYYMKIEKPAIALEFLQKSLALFSRLYGEYHPLSAEDYLDIAQVYISLQDFQQAQDYNNRHFQSLEINQGSAENYIANKLLRAEILMGLDQFQAAETLLTEVEDDIKETGKESDLERKLQKLRMMLYSEKSGNDI